MCDEVSAEQRSHKLAAEEAKAQQAQTASGK